MGKVMNPLNALYAILEVGRATGDPQRFVIAYRSESCLREVLVASCIVVTGYHSWEEAARACEVPALSGRMSRQRTRASLTFSL